MVAAAGIQRVSGRHATQRRSLVKPQNIVDAGALGQVSHVEIVLLPSHDATMQSTPRKGPIFWTMKCGGTAPCVV